MLKLASILAFSLALPALALGGDDAPASATRAAQPGFLEQLDAAVGELVAKARPSVVQVVIRRSLAVADAAARQSDQVSTSGVIWSAEGHIVSLGGVFENTDAIEVTLASGQTLPAELVNTDEDTGIAVLKVNPAAAREPLQPVRLGSAKDLRPGSLVVAISNPFGLPGSAALGNVAGIDRVVKRGRMQLTDVLQISTPVNPGDPGGLLANARGELVGIVASTYERSLFDAEAVGKIARELAKFGENLFKRPGAEGELRKAAGAEEARFAGPSGPFTAQGIGFALPVEQVKAVVDRLRATPLAERGYLGVQVVPLESPAAGVAIVGVKEGSPAQKAGLRHHDIVLSYDGHEVGSMRDFKRLVLDSPVGRAIKIEVQRGDARVSVEAVLEPRGKKP